MKQRNPALTVGGIMARRPCGAWPRARLQAMFGTRQRVRLSVALADERIPIDDRAWLGVAFMSWDSAYKRYLDWQRAWYSAHHDQHLSNSLRVAAMRLACLGKEIDL